VNILVTGGAGFIGSHIADALINEGHSVSVVDDLSMGKRENVNVEAEFYQLDIRNERIKNLFKDEKFDAVVHQAAQMDVRKSVADPIFDASVNIIGTLNLLERCREYNVKKVLFSSTGGAIYGEQERFPADEDHPLRPLSPYGIAKMAIEKYLHYYHAVHGLNYVSLRYANVYGPRQNPQGEAGVVAIFATRMLAGEQPLINGDGTQTRDYVFVEDVVKANLLALQYEGSGIFNVGTGIETSVNEIFTLLRSITGATCEERHAPAKKGEQLRSVVDSQAIEKEFGWRPAIQLREGLAQTVEYFKRQGKR
jgi:UDP-glucose 4-epimerase